MSVSLSYFRRPYEMQGLIIIRRYFVSVQERTHEQGKHELMCECTASCKLVLYNWSAVTEDGMQLVVRQVGLRIWKPTQWNHLKRKDTWLIRTPDWVPTLYKYISCFSPWNQDSYFVSKVSTVLRFHCSTEWSLHSLVPRQLDCNTVTTLLSP